MVRRHGIPFFLAGVLFLLAGCGGSQDATPLGAEFRLHPGEDITIAGEDLTISFISVTNDSRCPTGVQCPWEGNAEVHMRMARTGHPESEAVLNTSSQFAIATRYLDYIILLNSLDPQPSAGTSIAQAAYVARFIAQRSSN